MADTPSDERTMGHLHAKYGDLEYNVWYSDEGFDFVDYWVIYKGHKLEGLEDWVDFIATTPDEIPRWFDAHKEGLERLTS